MITVNSQKDSVSPLPLSAKPKKWKSQTVTPTLPKSQGPEAPGALSKKRQKPKSKKPPTETKVTPPKPTEGSEQSHSVPSGTVPDPQDLEINIQLASTRFPSTLDEDTRKSQPLPEGPATHPKDSGGYIQPLDRYLTSTTSDEGTTKITLHLEGSLGDKDLRGNMPPADMEPIHPTVADLSGTGAKYKVDETQSTRLRTPSPKQDRPEPSHVQESTSDSSSPNLKKFDNILPLTKRQLIKYLKKMSRVLFSRITETQWEQHEEAAVSYADLKASIEEYYDENVAHRDQTDKLVETTMSTIDRSSTTIKDLYQGLNVITKLLKYISTTVQDDLAINDKLDEAIETFARISTNTTEVLSLVKDFDFSTLQSSMKDLQAHALKQLPGQSLLPIWLGILDFKGQSSSAPSSSVTPTLALTNISANVEGENATNTATEEPPSHTPRIDKGKGIATESNDEPSKKLVPASTIVCPDPDEEVKLSYMINGKMCYLTDTEMQVYLDKEEKLRKADEEARLLAISKPEFKKAQDAEHQVLKREHSQKVKRLTKLNKKRDGKYMNNDKRNFDVHQPFKFTDFGITELGSIIQKKKNSIVKDLMTSLIKRYERLKKIPEELEIQYAIPVPAFQRWNDIHKVGVDSLLSYMVISSMVNTEENARFSLKLKKLIAEHPDQEKLKSKKVKIEALRYQID
ncbi:hypothetical protein Tco_0647578 [Tanacetum coccineum]